MKLVTSQQMREIDRRSIEERGVPASTLMDQAGRAVALDVADNLDQGPVVVVCGRGNNGGDGYVAARYLANAGWPVAVAYLEEPPPGDSAARGAWEAIPPGVQRHRVVSGAELAALLTGADAIVDALLGIGLRGAPRSPHDELIEAMNAAGLPVFAVDVPSGLDADTGAGAVAVTAWRTITMGLPKVGMICGDGPARCGTVRVERLGFPADLLDSATTQFTTLTAAEAARLLPHRPRDAHKGLLGLVVVAAGSGIMPGAAVLAVEGALRSGVGLVRAHVPRAVCPIIAHHWPEALLSPSAAPGDGNLRPVSPPDMAAVAHRATAMVIGPGMGQAPGTAEFIAQALAVPVPTVLDADALNWVASRADLRTRVAPGTIMTPHPGEAARLMGSDTATVQSDRWGAAASLAGRSQCVVVLKGNGTLVANPAGEVAHIPAGNTAWSRGGAGDVLAGLIGGLLAQGVAPFDAARVGAFVHGMAADIHSRDASPRGATIREVAACIPLAFRELERMMSHG